MEAKRKASLPRQASFSKRNSIVGPMVGFARGKKVVYFGIFFAVGVLCGHIISQLVGSAREVSSVRLPRGDNQHPAAERAAMIAEAEKAAKKEVHSRRKDLSVQFRDYVPRSVFINCGGTFPKSVELFLDTYPSSEKFFIFSFVPDESYAPLYSVYQYHVIISPAMCGAVNGSVRLEQISLTGETRNVPVPTVDIAKWIMTNTHADEHIVLKVDAPADVERDIAKRLAETSAIEWVNKFYTTSRDKGIMEFYNKEFSLRREKAESWDEYGGTYSDYDKVNPTRNPPTTKAIIKECGNPKLEKYPLFFYAPETTPSLSATLTVLRSLADSANTRLNVGIFLPFCFVKTYRKELEKLYIRMDVGLYFNTSMKTSSRGTKEMAYTRIRNQFVGAENRFGSAGLILQYVMAGRGVNSSLVERLVEDRHYNVFVKTIEIIPNTRESDSETTVDVPKIEDYEIPVLDISRPESVTAALFLLKRHETNIIALTECLKYASRAS